MFVFTKTIYIYISNFIRKHPTSNSKSNDFIYSRRRISFQHCIIVTTSLFLSLSLSLESGFFDLPHNNDLINLEIIATPEPTLPETQHSSSTNTQPISSDLETRHSPTPPPTNLQVTIDNITYTKPSKKKYNNLEDPVLFDYSIPSPVLQPVKNPSQRNIMTDEFPRTHPNFKANILSLYMTPTT